MRLSLYVLVGSALGGLARFWLGAWAATVWSTGFPWGTLLINALGSLIIGLASATLPGAEARAFVMVGICGGFTTFSSYSLQAFELLQGNRPAAALAYMASSVALCLAATTIGWGLGRLV